MVSLPNFAISLQKLLHKLVKKEATAAAKSINDIASGPLSRQTLMDFQPTDFYKTLLTVAPLLMTVLYGTSSRQSLAEIQVTVNHYQLPNRSLHSNVVGT